MIDQLFVKTDHAEPDTGKTAHDIALARGHSDIAKSLDPAEV